MVKKHLSAPEGEVASHTLVRSNSILRKGIPLILFWVLELRSIVFIVLDEECILYYINSSPDECIGLSVLTSGKQ